jgi:alpha-1,3-rhamnosyltransferase
MDQKPLVTVIVPAYNHEQYVEQAVRSVLDQTYENIEFIVIDDGSADSTAAQIERVLASAAPRSVAFLRQKNAGLAGTLNRGIAMAKGEYIAFLASDDAYLPTRIEEGVNAMERAGERVAMAYSDGIIMDGEGQRIQLFSSKYPVPIGKNVHKELLIYNWVLAPSVTYRKTALLACGPYDEKCGIEDHDMLLRLSERNTFAYIPKPLVLYRWHASNYSANPARMQAQFAMIVERHADLKHFMEFKAALKNRDVSGFFRSVSLRNSELLLRLLIRKIQIRRSRAKQPMSG